MLMENEVLSNIVNMIFQNFEKVYGSAIKVKMSIDSEDPLPTLKITENKTLIDAHITMHIKNPYNADYDAAIVTSNIQVEL